MAKRKRAKVDLARFLDVRSAPHQSARRRGRRHPKGLEPGIRLDPTTGRGEIVAAVPAGQDPRWAEILKRLGFGEVVEVLDVVEVRAWEVYSAEHGLQQLQYVKARVRRRDAGVVALDVAELVREVRKRQVKRPAKGSGERALVVGLADWQMGKRDGDGVRGTVERVLALPGLLSSRVRELRGIGRPVSRIVLACMGDLVEGCDGHYPMQAFQVELDRREQCRAVRRLLLEVVAAAAREAAEVVVAALPGNHGENRRGGKAYTTFGDNDDVAVVEQVAEICEAHPTLKEVGFAIPRHGLTLTLDVYGATLGLAHGHQARGGGTPREKVIRWWRQQSHNRHPVGDADVLLTAHYHHLVCVDDGPRTWLQCPTLDGGSQWWAEQGGAWSNAATLTFTLGKDGWDDLKVLR